MKEIKSVRVIKSFPTSDGYIKEGTVGYDACNDIGFKKTGNNDSLFVNKETIKQFEGEYFEIEREPNKIDFSEFIRRGPHDNLCIIGTRGILEIIYGDDVDIIYKTQDSLDERDKKFTWEKIFSEAPDYEETWLSELEYGDLFIEENIAYGGAIKKEDFKIFITQEEANHNRFYYLTNKHLGDKYEFINNGQLIGRQKVYKFLNYLNFNDI